MTREPKPVDGQSREQPQPQPGVSLYRGLRALRMKVWRRFRGAQDWLVGRLGSSVEGRTPLVARMLQRGANEAMSYWLQLVVAVGIATLGLVVGSVAVIIGAMLVAPLMGPIVALAMGLATGSPFLVLRSAARIILSVGVAIGGAALITLLLPFHELNAEIVSRTSPTVLDLLTAGFCALAGVYASLRPGSDTATTAAGTSIGISLVPPLCASGYGFGTGMWTVAGGAALLFLTNLVAIIFVGTVAFVLAGFNRVDATALDRDELAKDQNALVAAAIARRLATLFESRAGPALRFLMPMVLLASVYVPLRRALDEMAWQVRTRGAVENALARVPHQIVQSRTRVERHKVDLRVVLLGTTTDAQSARDRLMAEIEVPSGVHPHIEVLAIPDATAFAGLQSTLMTPKDPPPAPPLSATPSPSEQIDAARSVIRSNLARLWPSATAGEPLDIEFGAGEGGPLRVRVVHQGAGLGADAAETLRRSLRAALLREVQIIDIAIPAELLTRTDGDLTFVSKVASSMEASATIDDIYVCVAQPASSENRARVHRSDKFDELMRRILARHPRVTRVSGSDWSVRFQRGPCPEVPAAPAQVPAALKNPQ